MVTTASRTLDLLLRMQAQNDDDLDRGGQRLHPPDRGTEICMLDASVTRPLSPMLQARYRFCGHWQNARLSQDWLSLGEIASAMTNNAIREAIKLRVENWDFVPPATVSRKDCALFAFNPHENDETYLEWRAGRAEPVVWTFFDAEVSAFFDFNRYLEYIVGERDADDTDGSGGLLDLNGV
jgi:hypothetical protein